MPQKLTRKSSAGRRRNAAFLLAAIFAVASLPLILGGSAHAQTRRPRGGATKRPVAATPAPQPGGAAAQNANTPQTSKPQSGRLTPLRSSDTSAGSKVTITSDVPLNDYSAYRSGDRYYVRIPKADAGAVANSVRGRGFEDAQVQRQGGDVVLSFKLQPGASARVNQRFNRLDVEFAAPGASAANTTRQPDTTPTQNNTSATTTAPTNQQTTTNTQTQNVADTNRPANVIARNNPATPGTDAASPGFLPSQGQPFDATQQTPEVTPTTPLVETSPLPAPTVAEQIAQVQQPAPVTATRTTAAPSVGAGSSIGSIILNNWPLALIATLLLAGIGLFFASRRSPEAAEARPEIVAATKEPVALKAVPTAKVISTSDSAAAATSTVSPAASDALAGGAVAATTTAAIIAPVVAKTTKTEEARKGLKSDADKKAGSRQADADAAKKDVAAKKEGDAKRTTPQPEVSKKGSDQTIGAVLTGAALIAGAGTKEIERATKETRVESKEIAAAAFDADRVQDETRKLLAGESFDESVIGVADVGLRELVAAELLAALAGRNQERRERARTAFTRHGYAEDAARNLQTAEAPAERASAARALGLLGDRDSTPHLVAALHDPATEVRRASVEALAEVKDPAAVAPLEELREREKEQKRKVPRMAIMHAIEVSAAAAAPAVAPPVEEEPAASEVTTPLAEQETTTVETAPVAAVVAEETPALVARDETLSAPVVVPEETQPLPTLEELAAPVAEEINAPAEEVEAPAAESVEEFVTSESATRELTAISESAPAATVEAARSDVVEPTRAEVDASLAALEQETREASVKESAAVLDSEVSEEARPLDSAPGGSSVAEELTLETEPAAFEGTAVVESSVVESRSAVDALAGAIPEAAKSDQAAVVKDPDFELDLGETLSVEPTAATIPEAPAEAATTGDTIATTAAQAETVSPTEETPAPVAEVSQLTTAPQPEFASPLDTKADDAATPREMSFEFETHREPPTAADEAPDVLPFAGFEMTGVSEAPVTDIEPASDWIDIDVSQPSADAAARTVAVEPRQPDEVRQPVAGKATAHKPVPQEKSVELAAETLSTVPREIQERLASDESDDRVTAIEVLARLKTDDAFNEICSAFDDDSREVRDAAARALFNANSDRADAFTRALREAAPARRRKIGAAISTSGLAGEAIAHLTGESRDKTYESFSLLFLMAKAGEVQPLIRAIEAHPDNEVRLAVVKLLALSGQQEILPAFRRLAVRGSLPTEVRSAVMEAIYQISSQPVA